MTDENKKILIEFLGEKYIEMTTPHNMAYPSMCDCPYCLSSNRTFTTWQDYGDLKDKLVEKGLIRLFGGAAYLEWAVCLQDDICYEEWLINPLRIEDCILPFVKKLGEQS